MESGVVEIGFIGFIGFIPPIVQKFHTNKNFLSQMNNILPIINSNHGLNLLLRYWQHSKFAHANARPLLYTSTNKVSYKVATSDKDIESHAKQKVLPRLSNAGQCDRAFLI